MATMIIIITTTISITVLDPPPPPSSPPQPNSAQHRIPLPFPCYLPTVLYRTTPSIKQATTAHRTSPHALLLPLVTAWACNVKETNSRNLYISILELQSDDDHHRHHHHHLPRPPSNNAHPFPPSPPISGLFDSQAQLQGPPHDVVPRCFPHMWSFFRCF